MTLPTRLTSFNSATITPKSGGYDEYGLPLDSSTPYNITCSYEVNKGNTYKDQEGTEFVPKTIFYYEMPPQGAPSVGDTIQLDGFSAETIVSVRVEDAGVLQGQEPDLMVMTG